MIYHVNSLSAAAHSLIFAVSNISGLMLQGSKELTAAWLFSRDLAFCQLSRIVVRRLFQSCQRLQIYLAMTQLLRNCQQSQLKISP